ncbi:MULTISPECIES: hypothetical protein [Nostoc]|uniref:hypothetical protein n=1 Tax=Nostoc TaxID=1177 RepID=UPI0028C3BBC2|nr:MULTISPECIES: hypothetical protein [Nostoc]
MFNTVITREKIELQAGTVVRMLGSWEDYQALTEQLGDRAIPRIKYRTGEILLMAPLPEHGRDVALLADIAKVLLDRLEQRYDSFTPITMSLPGLYKWSICCILFLKLVLPFLILCTFAPLRLCVFA